MTQGARVALGARLAVCFIAGLLSAAGMSVTSAALAGGSDWRVSDIQGDARVRVGASTAWTALSRGDEILPGSEVETRDGGRLLLVRPGDSINVSPNSRFAIPRDAGRVSTPAHPTTHVIQKIGTLLFKITTRPDKPFSVKTPYLAAVIKGTIFTVAVNEQNSALHVSRGAVQVSSILNGDSVLVRPGQTAAAGPTNGGRLQLIGFNRTPGPRHSSDGHANATETGDNGKPATSGITAADLAGGGRTGHGFRIGHVIGGGEIDVAKASKGLLTEFRGAGGRRRTPGARSAAVDDTGHGRDTNDNAATRKTGRATEALELAPVQPAVSARDGVAPTGASSNAMLSDNRPGNGAGAGLALGNGSGAGLALGNGGGGGPGAGGGAANNNGNGIGSDYINRITNAVEIGNSGKRGNGRAKGLHK